MFDNWVKSSGASYEVVFGANQNHIYTWNGVTGSATVKYIGSSSIPSGDIMVIIASDSYKTIQKLVKVGTLGELDNVLYAFALVNNQLYVSLPSDVWVQALMSSNGTSKVFVVNSTGVRLNNDQTWLYPTSSATKYFRINQKFVVSIDSISTIGTTRIFYDIGVLDTTLPYVMANYTNNKEILRVGFTIARSSGDMSIHGFYGKLNSTTDMNPIALANTYTSVGFTVGSSAGTVNIDLDLRIELRPDGNIYFIKENTIFASTTLDWGWSTGSHIALGVENPKPSDDVDRLIVMDTLSVYSITQT